MSTDKTTKPDARTALEPVAETPAPEPARRPDAVRFKHNSGQPGVPRAAKLQAADRAAVYLGCDPKKGERAWCRQHREHVVATREQRMCLYFPEGHERSGQERYEWKDRGDGVEEGTLVEGAGAEDVGLAREMIQP